MRNIGFIGVAMLAALAAVACGNDESKGSGEPECAVGAEGCACTEGGVCDPGLECRSQLCVEASPLGGSTSTGGAGTTMATGGGAPATGGSQAGGAGATSPSGGNSNAGAGGNAAAQNGGSGGGAAADGSGAATASGGESPASGGGSAGTGTAASTGGSSAGTGGSQAGGAGGNNPVGGSNNDGGTTATAQGGTSGSGAAGSGATGGSKGDGGTAGTTHGDCQDTSSDPFNCGACGRVCRGVDSAEGARGCLDGDCCDGGQCAPAYGPCIIENDGFSTCADYCSSIGEECAARGCINDNTWYGWASTSSCENWGTPPYIAETPCDEPIPWFEVTGPDKIRCCCTDTQL